MNRWHKADEVPPEPGKYLVTVVNGKTGKKQVVTDICQLGQNKESVFWVQHWMPGRDKILAWMSYPAPYSALEDIKEG